MDNILHLCVHYEHYVTFVQHFKPWGRCFIDFHYYYSFPWLSSPISSQHFIDRTEDTLYVQFQEAWTCKPSTGKQYDNGTYSKLQTWKVLARALSLEKNTVMGGHSDCLDNVHDGCYLSLGFMPSTFLPWNTHTHEHVSMHTYSQDQ